MDDVKLIGLRLSPFVNRVQIALNIKTIEYEFIEEVDYSNKSELLLKSNPVHKKVPVLIHNEKPICESLVIVEYIDELWTSGPSILPSDPYDRAVSRFWAAYIDDKIVSSMRGLRTAKDEDKLKEQNQIVDALVLLEGTFIKCSEGQGFFGGDKIGYLDIVLGCYLSWIKATEKLYDVTLCDELKTPNLVKWGERFCSNDAVKDVMPGVEELINVLTMFNKMTQAQSTK